MIGLEVHCHMTRLQSKLFCPCKADYRQYRPNENTCPVCAGLPGALPRLNQEAVRTAAKIAMALGCKAPETVSFFRKHYFYPDMPKNFQITQLDMYGLHSMGHDGSVQIGDKSVRIKRVQLEEDPGRLVHEGASEKTRVTLADYNRAGVPMVEIVTEPDFETPADARRFLNMIGGMLENMGVADTGLEGAMRADGNVSVPGGSKVEVKNVDSVRDLEKALHFELTRQQTLVDRGLAVEKETRQWDANRKSTVSARKKEEAMDYRYMLEADVPHVAISTDAYAEMRSSMPETTGEKMQRYQRQFGIAPQVAEVLASDKFYSDLFEGAHTAETAKDVANMITTDLMGLADTRERRQASKISSGHLRELADAISAKRISRASAKAALLEMHKTGRGLGEIIADLGLGRISGSPELLQVVRQVVSEESKAVGQLAENPGAINYLVGKVMAKTAGKADPDATLELLKKETGSG